MITELFFILAGLATLWIIVWLYDVYDRRKLMTRNTKRYNK